MKKFIFSLLMLCSLVSYSQKQVENYFTIGGHIAQSVNKTLYTDATLLLGFSTDDGDEFYIGPVYRRLYDNKAHQSNYFGGSILGQTGAFYPIVFSIKADFLQGEYLMGEYYHPEKISVMKKMNFFGTVSLGYMVTDQIGVAVGYNRFIYNPNKYTTSAFQQHSFVLTAKYAFKFNR